MTEFISASESVMLVRATSQCGRPAGAMAFWPVVSVLAIASIAAHADCPPWWISTGGVHGGRVQRVESLLPVLGGNVFVGGSFDVAGSQHSNNVAWYQPRTNSFLPILPGIDLGPTDGVHASVLLPDGDIVVGGQFQGSGSGTAHAVYLSNIGRYHPGSNTWTPLGQGVRSWVYALAVTPSGDVIAGGGSPMLFGDTTTNAVARYSPETDSWSSLGFSIPGQPYPGEVYAIACLPNGDLLIGGSLRGLGGDFRPPVYRFIASRGVWEPLGSQVANGDVRAILVLPDGDVLIGGTFSVIGSGEMLGISRFSMQDGRWRSIESIRADGVNCLSLATDGSVLVGGGIFAADHTIAYGLARYDPVTHAVTSLSTDPSQFRGGARSIASLANGDALIGGGFEIGLGEYGFARYSLGRPLVVLQTPVVRACPSEAAHFLVDAYGDGPFTFQWRKDGREIDSAANPSAATKVLFIDAPQVADAGTYDCVVLNRCGVGISDPATLAFCAADFNCDGFLDFFDYDAFVDAFETAGGLEADFNGDGFVDFFDYDDFVLAFETGC